MQPQRDVEAGISEPLLAPPGATVVPAGAVLAVAPPNEHWTRQLARRVTTTVQNMGTSLLFGCVTAFGLKTIGQALAIAVVLLFLGFQVLVYYGFVNFKWGAVSSVAMRHLDLDQDGKLGCADISVFAKRAWVWGIAWGVPSAIGFLAGFWFGWHVL